MILQKPRKFSTVNLRVLEQEEVKTLDGGECVWTDVKEGKIANWREISRNRNEWMKAIEEAKVCLGL